MGAIWPPRGTARRTGVPGRRIWTGTGRSWLWSGPICRPGGPSGTLIQDLGDALRPFHQGERDLWHPICTAPGSLLHRLWGSRILINSAHHQAADRLGDGLRRTAWSEGGVTEAVEHSCLPVAAVQFHPERLDRTGEDTVDGAPLFRWLTARAAG